MTSLRDHTLPSVDGEIPIREKGARGRPAVIVLHQAGGMSAQIEETVEALSDEGFWAIAPDLFHRKAGEAIPLPTGPEGFLAFDRWLSGDADVRSDLAAVLDYVGSADVVLSRTGLLGFSYGGRAAYLGATEWKLGAAVSYYGPGVQRRNFAGNDDLPTLSDRPLLTPWLGLYGESDIFVGVDELDELAGSLKNQSVGTELIRYPGAVHGFDVNGPRSPQPFDPEPGDDARRRTLAFLRARLFEG